MKSRILTLAMLATIGSQALAVQVIYGPGTLNNPDVVQWNAYDQDGTQGTVGYFPFGSNLATVNVADNFTGLATGGTLEVRTEGVSWFGEMNPGDGVLWMHDDYASTQRVFHIQFASAVSGFALQSQSNAFGNYGVSLGAWSGEYGQGGTLVSYGSTTGTNSASEAGTQGWLGIQSTVAEITDVYVAVTMADGGDTFGAGFGPLHIESQPVPEPGTMAAIGLGLAAMARRRRK